MRLLRPFPFALLLASGASGQDLTNANFEQGWSATRPNGWSVAWTSSGGGACTPNPVYAFEHTSYPDVHCGLASCRLDTFGLTCGNYHFGKQWNGVSQGTVLVAKARFKCETLPPGAQVEILAAEFDSSWQMVAGQIHDVMPLPDWQEVTLQCTSTLPASSGGRLRFMVRMSNADNMQFFIDNIDFAGSDAQALNGTPALPDATCWEIKGDELATTVDFERGYLRDIRRVTDTGTPVGPNLLIDGGSPIGAFQSSENNNDSTVFYSPKRFEVTNDDLTSTDSAWSVVTPPVPGSSDRIVLRAERATPVDGSPGGPISDDIGIVLTIHEPLGTSTGIAFTHEVDAGDAPSILPDFIEGVTAPILRMRVPDSGSGDSWLFTPRDVGQVARVDADMREDPNSPGVGPSVFEYPASASMQVAAFYNDIDGGLTIRAEDLTAETKFIDYHIPFEGGEPASVSLKIGHRLSSITGAEQTFEPYPTIVEPSGTDWMSAIEPYRDSMQQAPWVLESRRQDDNISAWVLERPTLIETNLRPLGLGEELVPIMDWPCVLDDWGNFLGTTHKSPMLALFRNFENFGTYASPHYLPVQVLATDSDPAAPLHRQPVVEAMWRNVDAAGHHGMTMIAGMKYATYRNDPLYLACSAPGSTTNRKDWFVHTLDVPASMYPNAVDVVHLRDGTVWQNTPNAAWDSFYNEIDPTGPLGQKLHDDVATALATNGMIDLYLFDQLTGLRDNFAPPIVANTATHDPGSGRWKSDALWELFEDTLAKGRDPRHGDNAEFELTVEHLTEIFLQSAAIQGGRVNKVEGFLWRADQTRVLPVPAFQFVYGDVTSFVTWGMYLQATSASSLMTTAEYERRRRLSVEGLGRSFAAGVLTAIGYEQWQLRRQLYSQSACGTMGPRGGCAFDVAYPVEANLESDLVTMVQGMVRTEQGPARDMLNYGRMERTQGFAFDPASGLEYSPSTWWALDASGDLASPPVVHTARVLSASEFGLFFVNVDAAVPPGSPHTVTMPTHIGGKVIQPNAQTKIFLNGSLWQSGLYGSFSQLTIPPLGVVFVQVQ